MPDEITACLKADEATVIQLLTTPPYNHTYVQTFGIFTNGHLRLNVYTTADGSVGGVGAVVDAGDKVLIHTLSP